VLTISPVLALLIQIFHHHIVRAQYEKTKELLRMRRHYCVAVW